MGDPPAIGPETAVEKARVFGKLLLRRHRPIRQFCKKCGRTHRDFIAYTGVWSEIEAVLEHLGGRDGGA